VWVAMVVLCKTSSRQYNSKMKNDKIYHIKLIIPMNIGSKTINKTLAKLGTDTNKSGDLN
jgi:hypothetical protein